MGNTRTGLAARRRGIDAILAPARILRLYDSAQAATPETAATGTLLVEYSGITFGAADGAGVAKITNLTPVQAAAGGVARWGRLFEIDGVTPVADGDVGATGSGANFELPDTTIIAGADTAFASVTYTLPMQGT